VYIIGNSFLLDGIIIAMNKRSGQSERSEIDSHKKNPKGHSYMERHWIISLQMSLISTIITQSVYLLHVREINI